MRLKRVAVVLIASLSFLAACNGDDTPSSEPSDTGVITGATDTGGVPSSAPSSPTEPPETTPSSDPKATRDGAIAAAKAGVEAIDHAYATFDVKPLQELTNLGSCELCREIARRFPRAKADGWTMEGGKVTFTDPARVDSFVPSAEGTSTLAEVIVPISIGRLVTRKPDGSVYTEYDVLGSGGPHVNVAFRVTVIWGENEWRVQDVKREENE